MAGGQKTGSTEAKNLHPDLRISHTSPEQPDGRAYLPLVGGNCLLEEAVASLE